MFRLAVATALVLSAFGAHATSITYANTWAGDGFGIFPIYTVGTTFTISEASVLDSWSYYSYPDSTTSGKAKFVVAEWDGTKATTTLYSSIFNFTTNSTLTFNAGTTLAAGTYAAFVTTVGLTDGAGPGGYLKTGNSQNILPGGGILKVNQTGAWQGYGNRPQYSATFSSLPPPVSAVPEPETYAMMFAGLGVMGLVARRKRRAS